MTDSREDTVLVRAFSLEPMTRHLDNREADVDADERTGRSPCALRAWRTEPRCL